MRNTFLTVVFSGVAALIFLNSCDKRSGGEGCLIPRSVYSHGTVIALSFINKDSANLLSAKALEAKDIEVTYGNTFAVVDTVLLYHGNDPTSLKYIAFWKPDKVGDNSFTVTIKGTPHLLTFNQTLIPAGCVGPQYDLSDFKLDNKTVEPIWASEAVYFRGNKGTSTFSKIYIVL
ncbi:MAG: hypothetical protein QM594_19720 [Niabella sp.]